MPPFTFRFRRDYSWRWAIENPVLEEAEPGVEKNTGRFKLGDGHTPWNELEYFVPGADADGEDPTALSAHIHDETPHPAYDDGPSLTLLYENAKV